MPNHIKNRITLSGDQQKINELIEKFSTFYPQTERKAYDGCLIYIHKETNEPGWLDVGSQIFTRRGKNDSESIPDGFEQAFEPAWTRFPDFNKIVPMPDELHINSDGWVMPLENQFSSLTIFKDHLDKMREHFESDHVSKTETLENFIQGIRNYINHGHATWHSFSRENWGTKWNAYECEKLSENVFEFETAWSGVPDIICKMSSQFPDVKIQYEYSDEDTGSNCGIASFKNGIGEVVRYKSQSNEAYELAFKLRPSVMEYYELIEGKWQYKDDD